MSSYGKADVLEVQLQKLEEELGQVISDINNYLAELKYELPEEIASRAEYDVWRIKTIERLNSIVEKALNSDKIANILDTVRDDDHTQTLKDLSDFSRKIIETLIKLNIIKGSYMDLRLEVEREIKYISECSI